METRRSIQLAAWAVMCFAVLAVFALFDLQIDTRLDRMLEQDDAVAARYEALLEAYGSDEFVVVAVSGKPLFAYETLDPLLEIYAAIEAVPYVRHVSGIPEVFLNRFGAEDPEGLEEELRGTPFYENLFISPDGTIAGLLVETEVLDARGSRRVLVDGVDEAVQPLRDMGFRVDLVGVPVINVAINGLTQREALRMFPIAAVLALTILLVQLRSIMGALVVVSAGTLTVLLTLGALAVSGRPLNVVTFSLPIVLWVLALANSIHLVTRFQHYVLRIEHRDDAIEASLVEIARPCILSAVTTAAGFLSLQSASVPPIREFGLLMSLGMLISLACNLFCGAYFLRLYRAGAPAFRLPFAKETYLRLGEGAIRFRWGVIAAFVIAFAASIALLPTIRAERNTLAFLPSNAPTVDSYLFVGENLTGMLTMDILIDTPGGWLEPATWPAIDRIVAEMQALEGVARVISPLDSLRKIRQWERGLDASDYRLPDSQDEAEELIGLLDDAQQRRIERMVRRDGGQIRLSVLLRSPDSTQYLEASTLAETLLAELPGSLRGDVTGRSLQMQHMQRQLVESQVNTFGFALALVFAVIVLGMRSWLVLGMSIVPNLVPIFSTFGVMALAGIALDPGTVMVASIAMGIAVDDTMHLSSAYLRHARTGYPARAAILQALLDVGPAMTVTSFTACAGFFTLAVSAFRPMHYFGILAGIAIMVALLAALFFVPALLAVLYREPEAREEAPVESSGSNT